MKRKLNGEILDSFSSDQKRGMMPTFTTSLTLEVLSAMKQAKMRKWSWKGKKNQIFIFGRQRENTKKLYFQQNKQN